MYDDYEKVSTSLDVCKAIRLRHPELRVFGSYSAPEGHHGGDQAVMFTSFGFDGADAPTIGTETTWDIDREDTSNRINEQHRYWLYFSVTKE